MTEESASSANKTEHILALSTEFEFEEESSDEAKLARARSPGLKDNTFYSSVSNSEDEGEEEIYG